MKHIVFTSTIVALMLSAFVYAEDDRDDRDGKKDGGVMSRQVMRSIDVDDDRRVSIEEYMAHAQQRFADADTDGDNFITREEGKAAAQAMRKKQDEARSLLSTLKERFTGDPESAESE